MMKLAVLGAGAVGMSTAVQLQDILPTAQVTIIADKFNEETTSDGAAGIFRPTRGKTPGVPMPILKQWLKDSWNHYAMLAHSVDAKEAGVQFISGYQFYNKEKNNPVDEELISDIVYNYRALTDREMGMFPGPRYEKGWFLTTVMAESRHYLPYLMKKFKLQGGIVKTRTINSFEEFVGEYDVVVNCSGNESYRLLNDKKMVPVRGQLFRVIAPWLQHFIYGLDDEDCYIIPGMDNVVIGGTRQAGDLDLEVRPADSTAIWQRACAMAPSLRKATVEWQWVGLRPFRKPLRLEKEIMSFPSGNLKVVHNYGHGAEGIGLSWGTATNAVQLVKQIVDSDLKAKL